MEPHAHNAARSTTEQECQCKQNAASQSLSPSAAESAVEGNWEGKRDGRQWIWWVFDGAWGGERA